jgi:hypothetical protein
MSAATGAGSDKSANADAGDTANAEGDNLDAKINRAITNHMKRMEAKMNASNAELIKNVITEAIAASKSDQTDAGIKASGNDAGSPDKLTLKAMEERYRALESKMAAETKSRQEAEERAIDARLRSEVRSKLAGAIDAKYLDVAMDSLYDARKRFALGEDGQAGVKFKREGGYEDIVPLEAGIKELVSSELKHFVPAKNAGLPPAGNNLRGFIPPTGPASTPPVHPFAQEILTHFQRAGSSSPIRPDSDSNGTNQK